ncbi:RNA polymerase sigma factor [bacterium]|nr:RNA polymerase sigma factor [bacterium]
MLKVRDGDLNKLGILFDRHHRFLFNFFLRLTSNREVSEDLVQEVFFRMLKYRHTYRGTSQFSYWMFRIARNARADYFSKKRREVNQGDEMEEPVDDDPIVSENMEKNQDSVLLHSALKRLPVEDREVLLLSRFQKMKYKEIAELHGCAVGTVKARVHHAVKKLRDVFLDLSGEKAI